MKGIGMKLDPATGDLLVRNGSAVLGETTPQNQALILISAKGSFKEHPVFGVGIAEMTNDHETTGWAREITLQLEADDMMVRDIEIDITKAKLGVDAGYYL